MVVPKFSPIHKEIKKRQRRFRFAKAILLLFFIILASKPFIKYDENGKPELAVWRKEKLKKELDDLSGAEQYVLLARKQGLYPCYSCYPSGVKQAKIFLQKGEVWKYGTTSKGAKRRYRNYLIKNNLRYIIQYEGSLLDCLKQEKIKIYSYPLLPESLNRSFSLIRPPGNKQDN